MPGLTYEDFQPVMELMAAAKMEMAAKFKASMVVHVATLNLLIDSGICSRETAIDKIHAVKDGFLEVFDDESVKEGIAWAVDLLNGQTPLHGSPFGKMMQKIERESLKKTPGQQEKR